MLICLEKLFDIARRVPFLAMTIVEKNSPDGQWLFRTQPLQTGTTLSTREIALELAPPPTPVPHHPIIQQKPVQGPPPPPPPPVQPSLQQQKHHPSHMQMNQAQAQRLPPNQILRPRVPTGPIPIDPKKVVKSSTAPNLPTSNSLSEMFRVI